MEGLSLKAVIFDFDGTMVDTEVVWYKKAKQLLEKEYQYDLSIDVFSKGVGTKDDELYQYLYQETNGRFATKPFRNKLKKLVHREAKELDLRPGFINFFNQTKQCGVKLGIATSSSREWIEPYLEKFQMQHEFDCICTSDDVKNIKPDPELYEIAVQKLGIKPEDAVAIEDSVSGSNAALEAGLHCIVVPNEITKHLTFSQQAVLYDQFEDINLKALEFN